jgi:hypothetical protein
MAPIVEYSGGYNKYDPESVARSMFFRHAGEINEVAWAGKGVCIVTLAKPDHYYDTMMVNASIDLDSVFVVDSTNTQVNWSEFDLVVVPGGDTEQLIREMQNRDFNPRILKPESKYIGDSAGTQLMCAKWVNYDNKSAEFSIKDGLLPESNLVVIVHRNNPRYISQKAVDAASEYASSSYPKMRLLELDENDEVVFWLSYFNNGVEFYQIES